MAGADEGGDRLLVDLVLLEADPLILRLKRRADVVTDGNIQDLVLKNAPDAREGFFAVPKVVE